MKIKTVIQLEELAMTALSIFLLTRYEAAWFWYLLLLLGPDISMLGYLGGNKTGAFFYNLFHHKAVALLVFAIAFYCNNHTGLLVSFVLFGHASLDRMLGYGLKRNEGFRYTHLGKIGKDK